MALFQWSKKVEPELQRSFVLAGGFGKSTVASNEVDPTIQALWTREPMRRDTINPMTESVSRPELDAKLDALRQEMRADSAALRGDFERMRADFASFGAEVLRVSSATNASVERLAINMSDLSRRVDDTATKVSNVKWWLAGAVLTIGVAVYGTSVAIQQMTVSTFQAGAQQQKDAQPAPAPTPQSAAPVINVYPAAPSSGAK